MATRRASPRAQRGLALLGLLAVIVMVFAWILTSRLNAANQHVALDREHNARVMSRAKAALIGYMAQQAATAGENNPGRLPCPEAVNAIGTSSEGIAAPLVSPSTPNCATVGRLPWRTLGLEKLVDATGEPLWYAVSPGWMLQTSSTLLTINADSVGSMTINGALDPTVVAVIVAPGPAMNVLAASGCTARVQARATPAPSIDARDYVECFNAGTPAFSTTGPATSFNDQVLAIRTAEILPALEAAIQVRMQREITPAVRSAAFELDTNSPRRWVATAILSTSPPPIYPYPVPFCNPVPVPPPPCYTPATSVLNYRGKEGTSQGLMPFAPSSGFVSFQTTPANAVKTTSAGSIVSQNCYWESASVYACEGIYKEDSSDPSLPITLQMNATFANVAMGFRARNAAALTAEAREDDGVSTWSTSNISASRRFEMNDGSVWSKPRGSVTVTLTATMPNIDTMGWLTQAEFRLRIDRAVIADHPLLSNTGRALRFSGGFSAINNGNTVTGATSGASGAVQVVVDSGSWSGGNATGVLVFSSMSGTFQSGEALQVSGSSKATSSGSDFDIGWFVRNEWFRNVYYAVADQNTPTVLPGTGGCDSSNCLRFNDSAIRNTRVLLVLAGRGLAGQTRPSATFSDYLEYQNADNGTFYEQRRPRADRVADATLNAPWNDRLVVADWITPNPTFPLAYVQ